METNPELAELLKGYMREHREDIPNRTLARIIYAKHPEAFTGVESIRKMIRYYRGQNGEESRQYLATEEFLREERPLKDIMKDFTLPAESDKIEPYAIPVAIKKMGVLADIHLPYHDERALLTAVEYVAEAGVDALYLNGDIIDCYKASRYTKDPTKRNLRYEIEMAQEFLDMLRAVFPTQLIIYKFGNHEDRWEQYLKQKAPDLFGDEYFLLEDRLGLVEWNIHHVKSKQLSKFGKLDIVHGHEFGRSVFNPVNPARGLFLRAKSSTIGSHFHQISEHDESNLKGDTMACWTTGCLCNLSPEYAPFAYTKWNHGFAMLEKDSSGNFTVHNHKIVDGVVR